MYIRKLILHAPISVPGIGNGEMRDQFVNFEATVTNVGVVIDVAKGAIGAASFRLDEGEDLEVMVPWNHIRVLYRRKEAKK